MLGNVMNTISLHSKHAVGDMDVAFIRDVDNRMAMTLVPTAMQYENFSHRDNQNQELEIISSHQALGQDTPSMQLSSMVQVHVRGDACQTGFSPAKSCCNTATSNSLQFKEQSVTELPDGSKTIQTVLTNATNPHFPALRSGPTAASGASLQKQITSSLRT